MKWTILVFMDFIFYRYKSVTALSMSLIEIFDQY